MSDSPPHGSCTTCFSMGLRHSKDKAKHSASKYEMPVERHATHQQAEFDRVKRYNPVHADAVHSVASLGSESFLSAGADKTIVAYHWREGRLLKRWTGHSRDVTKVAYSPSMDCMFSTSRDKTAKMWTREGFSSEARLTFVGHSLVAMGLAPVDVSRRLCTGGRDNSLRLWDTETGNCIRDVTSSRNLVTHMVTVPNTETVLQASEDKSLRLWDTRTMEEIAESNKKSYIQTCCDVSADGNYCVSCSNGFSGQGCEASLWDVRSLKDPVRQFKGHTQTASGCCFARTSGGRYMIVTCSHDQTVRLWDENSGGCLCSFTLPGSKQLTSVAPQENGSICVGSFETGVHILTLQESSDGSWEIREVCQY